MAQWRHGLMGDSALLTGRPERTTFERLIPAARGSRRDLTAFISPEASMTPFVASAIAALIALAPLTTQQDDRWQQQVRRQLDRAADLLSNDHDYTLYREPTMGSLRANASESQTITLTGGRHYMIVGVCDNDCTDIDLRLYDEDGDMIGSDIEDDDTPIVQVSPESTGRYRVRATMAACSVAPCRYGVGIYVR